MMRDLSTLSCTIQRDSTIKHTLSHSFVHIADRKALRVLSDDLQFHVTLTTVDGGSSSGSNLTAGEVGNTLW
jgi:hypothetical protein